jgi:hypothetical protein
MKKLLVKIKSHALLWVTESKRQEQFRLFLIRFADYFLNPEFRDEKTVRRVKATVWTPVIIAFTLFILSGILHDTKIMNVAKKIIGYTSDPTVFSDSIDSELLRSSIYDESGITVPKTVPNKLVKLMYDRCQEKDIPVAIFFRMVYFESRFDSTATSHVGAHGYCQLMPATHREWSKKLKLKGNSMHNNIIISTEMLSKLNNEFTEYGPEKSWKLTLASYNAGIGRVINAGYNIPNISETKKYIVNIIGKIDFSNYRFIQAN